MNGYIWVTEYWTDTWGWCWLRECSAGTRDRARHLRASFLSENRDFTNRTRVRKYERRGQ